MQTPIGIVKLIVCTLANDRTIAKKAQDEVGPGAFRSVRA